MTKHIMLLTDTAGRPSYGVTQDPVLMLARSVVEGRMTTKQAAAVDVYVATPASVDRKQLETTIARLKALEQYRRDPGSLVQAFNQNKVTREFVEGVRAGLVEEYPLEAFPAAWPWETV